MKLLNKPNKKYLKTFNYITPKVLDEVHLIKIEYSDGGKLKSDDVYFEKIGADKWHVVTSNYIDKMPKLTKTNHKEVKKYFNSNVVPITIADMKEYLKLKYQHYYKKYNGNVSITFCLNGNKDEFYICDNPNVMLCFNAFYPPDEILQGYHSHKTPAKKTGVTKMFGNIKGLENSVKKIF